MIGTPKQARGAVTAIFLLNGLIFGAWAARIPAVRDRVGLSDGELGIVLACAAVGSILAMPIAGGRAARIGSRRATRGAFALVCLATGLIALAPSLPVLCALAFFYGASMGSLDVTMNAHGVAVERRYGRAILASFHAAFSIGGLAGGALGALAAAVGLDVRVQLAIVAVASAAIGLTWSRRFLAADEDAMEDRAEPVFVRPPRKLLALGALAFACLLIEGASADWSAVYLRDELGTTAAVAAIGFTAFSVTMTSGGSSATGWSIASARRPSCAPAAASPRSASAWRCSSSAPVAAIAGFACLGAGMSGVVPIVFRAAGQVPGMPAGVGLAAVSSTGYLGFLVGPPTIGGLAELIGLPAALGVIVVLAAGRRAAGSHHPLRARRLGRGARAAVGGGMTTILSDLDGVLVDSHASIMRAWRWWGAEHGVEAEAIEGVQHGRPSGEIIAALAPDLDAAAESRAIDLRQADDVDGRHRAAGRARALRRRRARRDRHLVHRAAGHRAPARRRAGRAAGAGHARAPVARQARSRGLPARRPRARRRARRTAWSSRTRRPACEAGRAAGMHVVGITTTHDPAELDAQELAPSIAAWLASRRDGAPR